MIHAFCLMDNHIHFVMQVGRIPLATILHNLASRYSHWMNCKYADSGHLFQGRYRALLVDADSYLLELVRYVHLNPVRAGLVRTPTDFRWSSHRAYLGDQSFPWVTTVFVLRMFDREVGAARRLYRDFVRLPDASIDFHKTLVVESKDDRILGDDSFAKAVLKTASDVPGELFAFDVFLRVVCRSYGVAMGDLASRSRIRLLSEARAVLALHAREARAPSLSELGRRLGRDASTLSHLARGLESKAAKDERLAGRIKAIREAAIRETEGEGENSGQ
jgi:hypothetical protein